MRGSLYFLQEGIDGPIKIGFTTKHVRHRWLAVQSHNSRELRLLGVIDGLSKVDERKWHAKFASARIRGEWFWPICELRNAIEKLASPMDVSAYFRRVRPQMSESVAAIHAWMEANGIDDAELAKRLNCSTAYLSHRLYNGGSITRAMAKRIEVLTAGVIKADALRETHCPLTTATQGAA